MNVLSLDNNFADFITDKVEKRSTYPNRRLTEDTVDSANGAHRTVRQNAYMLDLMLGENYCPIISCNTIVKTLSTICQVIKLHYGFQSTSTHLTDFTDIRPEPDERPEDLYQSLVVFIKDSLLTSNGGISHHDERITEDTELTPIAENVD